MIKKIIITFLFLLLNSCEYSPVLYDEKNNFSIKSIKIENKNQMSYKVKNNLSRYLALKNKEKSFRIKVTTNEDIRITSKDEKGNIRTLELTVEVNLIILEGNEEYKKIFRESFAYKNKSNKFDLKSYENNIVNNLVDGIIIDINKYLIELAE